MTVSVDLTYPFTGRWIVQNSPATRVPSHGTDLFATSYAIDFVPVDHTGRTAPITVMSLLRPEQPEHFPGFGRPIFAPVDGIVVAAHDTEPDHAAYRGFPSISYAVTQRRRATAGWVALAGNHVFIEHEDVVIALCHLQHRSVQVSIGQQISAGHMLGRCGNSGNSTEPHLHVQAMDDRVVQHARAVPLRFNGALPKNGDIINVPGA